MISTPGTPQEKPIRTVKDKDKSYLLEITIYDKEKQDAEEFVYGNLRV